MTYYFGFQRNETIRLKYEEMSSLFVQILEKEAEKTEENLPTIMGVNLFGSVVNEFVKQKWVSWII